MTVGCGDEDLLADTADALILFQHSANNTNTNTNVNTNNFLGSRFDSGLGSLFGPSDNNKDNDKDRYGLFDAGESVSASGIGFSLDRQLSWMSQFSVMTSSCEPENTDFLEPFLRLQEVPSSSTFASSHSIGCVSFGDDGEIIGIGKMKRSLSRSLSDPDGLKKKSNKKMKAKKGVDGDCERIIESTAVDTEKKIDSEEEDVAIIPQDYAISMLDKHNINNINSTDDVLSRLCPLELMMTLRRQDSDASIASVSSSTSFLSMSKPIDLVELREYSLGTTSFK